MTEVMDEVEGAINIINESYYVKRLKALKKEMDKDDKLCSLFKLFNDIKKEYEKNLIITPTFIKTKEEIYNHPLVIEYRNLFSELNLYFLKFNKQLNNLINTKNNCHNS